MANVTQVNDVAPGPYVTLLSGVSLYHPRIALFLGGSFYVDASDPLFCWKYA